MKKSLLFSAVGLLCSLVLALSTGAINVDAQDVTNTVERRRAELQKKLEELEKEINVQETIVGQKKAENQSLQRDIDILNAQIKKSQLAVQARNLSINELSGEIGGKEQTIEELNEELDRERKSLAQLLRKRNELDTFTLVEVMLGNQNISEFFKDIDSFNEIQEGLQESFIRIENTKELTALEKSLLEGKREDELELRNIQVLEKKAVEQKESQKKEILEVSKGQEAVYQKILKEKQKTAAEIRAELFALRGSAAIPFGTALDHALRAEKQTGVRAALILGILTQETRLGEFLGNGNWRTDMHPTRDLPVFIELMERLGFDPDSVPVSAAPSYGYGGAMGPAQFIPSTWVLYEEEVGRLTGHVPPNPWEPGDAFMASAILLRDNGANKGTWDAERLAALRYFAGWKNATKPAYAFYGDAVMEFATRYQNQIDILGGS